MSTTEREFVIWLKGFLLGAGTVPTQRSWDILLDEVNNVNVTSDDDHKRLIHDGTLNIIRDSKK